MIRATPATTIHRVAAPGPVNAKEPEEALTTGAVGLCVSLDPDPVEALEADWVVEVVALAAADVLVVADVDVVCATVVVEDGDEVLVDEAVGGTAVVAVTATTVVDEPAGSDELGVGGELTWAVAITGDAGEPDGPALTMPAASASLG